MFLRFLAAAESDSKLVELNAEDLNVFFPFRHLLVSAKQAEAAACQRPRVRFGRKLPKVSGVVKYCGSPLQSASRTFFCQTAKLHPSATSQSKRKGCSWPATY
jgi:hypothetical protein